MEFETYVKKPIKVRAAQVLRAFEINTLEGTMKGKAGDYWVIGIKGENYPVDKNIFLETYEKVVDD